MKEKLVLYSEASVTIMLDLLKKEKRYEKICKYELTILKKMFNNFFSGREYLDDLEYIKNESYLNWLTIKYRYFRQLYIVANDNWSGLKRVLNTIDVNGKYYYFEYPGEFLSGVLAEEYEQINNSEIPYIHSKSYTKNLYLALRELYNGNAKGNKETSEKLDIYRNRSGGVAPAAQPR